MKDKRGIGTVNMLTTSAIIVLIAIITISIGLQVNTSVRDSQRGDATGIINEDLGTATAGTPITLANVVDVINSSGVTAIIYNPTSNNTLETDEFKLEAAAATFNLTNSSKSGNNSWINYSYYPHGEAYNASDSGNTGLAGFSDYWVSIVSIIVLIVIVGLFMMFGGGKGIGGIDIR